VSFGSKLKKRIIPATQGNPKAKYATFFAMCLSFSKKNRMLKDAILGISTEPKSNV
jgi:hypothetical protein